MAILPDDPELLRRDPLDVRQLPHPVKELFLWPIDAEHQLEAALRIGRHPVRLFAVTA